MEGYWVLALLAVQSVSGAFFDLTDVDDPLGAIWHSRDPTTPRNTECVVLFDDGSSAVGQCRHKTHCLLSGGQSHGHTSCGFLSTCCTQLTSCYKKTRSKVSYFASDTNTLTDCEFVVEALNQNVCQMRLDFEQFRLAPAEEVSRIEPDTSSTVCRTDYMTITPRTYHIPQQFCGSNDGQHVYVHLYSQRVVVLHVHIANRSLNPSLLPNPQWRIKITQLECLGTKNFFSHGFIESDFKLLAPEGAIQYFTAPTGTIRSFGFGNTMTSYISGLHYGIAIKRSPHVNCLRFLGNPIWLRPSVDASANPPIQCVDYLAVPELRTQITSDGWKICPNVRRSPTINLFFSVSPGPFYLHFVSRASHKTPDTDDVYGFDLHYDSTNCNFDLLL